MPTANSAHISNSRKISAITVIILEVLFLILFKAKLIKTPKPNNKIPAIMKSASYQLTSLVNCMAISGISNKIGMKASMVVNLLF